VVDFEIFENGWWLVVAGLWLVAFGCQFGKMLNLLFFRIEINEE
jgi:hypothetical protein